jgi:hypothetical protein
MQNRITTVTNFTLERNAFGRLVLIEPGGTRHEGVEPIRAFPISDPMHGLSLASSDGKELAWIDDINELPSATRTLIEAELREREFTPQIQRIVRVSLQTDPCEWEVVTDRGPTKFVLKSSSDVRPLDKRRALVSDAHCIHYLIADTQSLDRHSRRILERYL